MKSRRSWYGLMVLVTATVVVVGCGQAERNRGDKSEAKVKVEPAKTDDKVDDHSEWWCAPHGIPEEICGLCNKEYQNQMKAKGDWCEEHKRLKSQCFKCDPTLYERVFEPMYVAKYNKKPDRPPESQFKK